MIEYKIVFPLIFVSFIINQNREKPDFQGCQTRNRLIQPNFQGSSKQLPTKGYTGSAAAAKDENHFNWILTKSSQLRKILVFSRSFIKFWVMLRRCSNIWNMVLREIKVITMSNFGSNAHFLTRDNPDRYYCTCTTAVLLRGLQIPTNGVPQLVAPQVRCARPYAKALTHMVCAGHVVWEIKPPKI